MRIGTVDVPRKFLRVLPIKKRILNRYPVNQFGFYHGKSLRRRESWPVWSSAPILPACWSMRVQTSKIAMRKSLFASRQVNREPLKVSQRTVPGTRGWHAEPHRATGRWEKASCQRGAQGHHRSPGLNRGNPAVAAERKGPFLSIFASASFGRVLQALLHEPRLTCRSRCPRT